MAVAATAVSATTVAAASASGYCGYQPNRYADASSGGEVGEEKDEVLEAIELLVQALRANTKRNQQAIRRAVSVRKMRAQGLAYRELVEREGGALLVEITRENLAALSEYGSRLRRAEAKALYREHMTMDQIAKLFGVTRQRVSALLREPNGGGEGEESTER
jgi:hypothetical protein